jgi:hypothetical protein
MAEAAEAAAEQARVGKGLGCRETDSEERLVVGGSAGRAGSATWGESLEVVQPLQRCYGQRGHSDEAQCLSSLTRAVLRITHDRVRQGGRAGLDSDGRRTIPVGEGLGGPGGDRSRRAGATTNSPASRAPLTRPTRASGASCGPPDSLRERCASGDGGRVAANPGASGEAR